MVRVGASSAKQEQHRRGDRFRFHQRQRLRRQQFLGHPRRRGRRDHVDADVGLAALLGQHVHQPDHAGFRGAIIGLAEIAVQARRRRGDDDAAIIALAHAVPHRLAAIESAGQMHVDHLGEIGDLHLGKGFVSEDAGIGAEQIDAAPFRRGVSDHRLDLLVIRDVGSVGHRLAAGLPDFLDHGFGRRQRTAAAVTRAAEIVDHDFGAAARQSQRVRASKPIARAGDDGDASVKPDCHVVVPMFLSSCAGLTRGIHHLLTRLLFRSGWIAGSSPAMTGMWSDDVHAK